MVMCCGPGTEADNEQAVVLRSRLWGWIGGCVEPTHTQQTGL